MSDGVASPCCAASRPEDAVKHSATQTVSAPAKRGSTKGMAHVSGGEFLMGTDSPVGFPADGEGPVRNVRVDPFYIDVCAVTNAQFARFVKATGHKTEAEEEGGGGLGDGCDGGDLWR